MDLIKSINHWPSIPSGVVLTRAKGKGRFSIRFDSILVFRVNDIGTTKSIYCPSNGIHSFFFSEIVATMTKNATTRDAEGLDVELSQAVSKQVLFTTENAIQV
jgi:hypothetical protein